MIIIVVDATGATGPNADQIVLSKEVHIQMRLGWLLRRL